MLPRGSAIGFISSAAGLGWEPNLDELNEYLDIADFDDRGGLGRGARQGRLHVEQAGDLRLRRPPGVPAPEAGHPHQRASARARPTRRWRRPTRRCGSASAPTTAARPGSRPRRRSSRRTRSCSCAATPPAAISGITMITDMRLHELGRHRLVPGGDRDRQPPPQPVAGAASVEKDVRREHGYHAVPVKRVVQETADTRSYVLDVPDDLRDTFRYRSGQFCTFRVHLGDGGAPAQLLHVQRARDRRRAHGHGQAGPGRADLQLVQRRGGRGRRPRAHQAGRRVLRAGRDAAGGGVLRWERRHPGDLDRQDACSPPRSGRCGSSTRTATATR